MSHSFLSYFTDPLLYASTLGCLLLGLGCGIVGTLLFLRKSSLMGETLSHASYPGLMLGILFLSYISPGRSNWVVDLVALLGAWLSSCLGIYVHSRLVRMKISSDAALCFVLSSFLGIGVLLASRLQFQAPRLYLKAQAFLYGQAATLSDYHLWLFGSLVTLILIMTRLFYRSLWVESFDREYATSLGLRSLFFRLGFHVLTTSLIVAGLRAGGVLVMAALLVAPAVAARWWSQSFKQMLVLAAVIGAIMGVLGNIFSLELESFAHESGFSSTHILPTGPSIVIVGCFIALISVLFAPEKGVFSRWRRSCLLKKKWIYEIHLSKRAQHVGKN